MQGQRRQADAVSRPLARLVARYGRNPAANAGHIREPPAQTGLISLSFSVVSQPSMQPSQQPGFRKQTVDTWQVFGGVAGVLSLVTGLSDNLTIQLTISAAVVLIGVALLYRWGRSLGGTSLGGFAIAVLVTILGAGMGGAAITARTTAAGTAAATAATTTTTTPTTSAGTTSQPATTSQPELPVGVGTSTEPWFTGEVRLTYGTGVDLDKRQPEGVDVEGPNGDVDLFMNDLNDVAVAAVRANGGELYADEGPEKDARVRCTATLKAQKDTSLFYGYAGKQYCFATSTGDVAWMRINDIVEKKTATDYVVLNVKVWGKAPA
ncbi:hypothetical protein ACQPW3_34930 [Actinosynnema sp. CA-248983]